MNLQCPSCQKMLNVEDKFSGQLMQCPMCGGTFTAPVLPGALGSGPAPAVPLAAPVGAQTSPSAGDVFSLAPASEPSATMEDRGLRTEDLGEKVKNQKTAQQSRESPIFKEASAPVADAPGSPAGDYPHRYIIWISPRVVPWIAPVCLGLVFFLFFFPWRSVPSNVPWETMGEPGSQIGWGKLLSSALLIFYLLIYLVALVLAIGSLLLTLTIVPVLPQIQHLVPWKAVIVAGMVAFAFLLLLFGCLREDFGTIWLSTAVWLHLYALVGLGLEFWLQRRGSTRPMPRIDVLW